MDYYTTHTKYNCGIDLHSKQMYVCVLGTEGEILIHKNIKGNDFEYFLKITKPYRSDMTVVCESTFNWYWLADACCEADIEFVLAHALYLKHIHGGKNKNDKIDSKKLAHLLRSNFIPPAYAYPAKHRPMRAMFRLRMNYVWDRSSLLGHLKMNQYAEGLVPVPTKARGRKEWEKSILDQYSDPILRMSAKCDIEMIYSYDKQIALLEKTLVSQAKKFFHREYPALLSVPGIGKIMALTILFEVDTINRFPTVKDFLSYSRLVKGSVASAGKIKGMTGGKMGNAYLRWAFGQIAITAKRCDPIIRVYAEKIINKHGKFKGNAILGNKIARCVYYMLKKGEVFDIEPLISKSF